MRLIVTWLITAVAIAIAVWIVPGIDLINSNPGTIVSFIILAALLALLNTFLKPILKFITMPLSVITLGLFALVVNTVVLYLAVWIANGLFETGVSIYSFWSALGASVVISIVTAILFAVTGVKDKKKKR